MTSNVLATVVQGGIAIGIAVLTAALTFLLTKKREREADWRKMKLDCYKDYMKALSGIVEGHDTPDSHLQYVHAVNSLTLVGSTRVLRALYAYMDETRNPNKTKESHDAFFADLVSAMREDINPQDRRHSGFPQFHLIALPPQLRSPQDSAQRE